MRIVDITRGLPSLGADWHDATHVEAPGQFFPEAPGVAELPPELWVGPAVVADLSHKGELAPISGPDLEQAVGACWEPGLRLLIRTDYPDRHRGDGGARGRAPFLTPGGAAWAVANQAVLVGLDCQPERPGDGLFPVHKALLAAGIPILAGIANLAAVRQRRVWLAALPLKAAGAGAAPARAVVVEGVC